VLDTRLRKHPAKTLAPQQRLRQDAEIRDA